MIIDTHAHALDEVFLDGLCRKPAFGLSAERRADGRFWVKRGDGAAHSLDENLSDIPRRIESLARRGVDLQLIGPPPGYVAWPGGAAGVEHARALNGHGARIASQGQGRLELMAALALADPARCAYELERAVDLDGARSALLPATAGGRPLDGEEFDPLFTVAERLGLLLFMHPVSAEPPMLANGITAMDSICDGVDLPRANHSQAPAVAISKTTTAANQYLWAETFWDANGCAAPDCPDSVWRFSRFKSARRSAADW